jgi:LPPG:FO 2-phospho-L-lactate transferase
MIVALAGGVGGAKLAHGLYQALPPNDLTVIVNTADDFELWGLHISPDLDTVMYTLAGIANPETGWGVAGDTWQMLDMLDRYGYDTWFRLGDRDVATHIARTDHLRAGHSLTGVMQHLSRTLGIHATLLPMCDQRVMTLVDTPVGRLQFQDYFVRRHHTDPVMGVLFDGIADALLTTAVEQALQTADTIVFCPSNPVVSIGPILAVPEMIAQLQAVRTPKVAVSPIIGRKALRGPADRMLAGMGHDVSAFGVASIYRGLIDGLVIDGADADQQDHIEQLGMRVLVTDTIMRDEVDRRRLASETLRFADQIRQGS